MPAPGKQRPRRNASASPPPGAAARRIAARALHEVLDQGRNLGDALGDLERELTDARDRALVRRLCNRVLRDRPALEAHLQRLVARPLARKSRQIHYLLLAALDELTEGREPAPAIVHASVAAARLAGQPHLAGLVNAVLRNAGPRTLFGDDPADPSSPAAERALGYPAWLLQRLAADWPANWRAIAHAGNATPPLWLRVNRRRADPATLAEHLAADGLEPRRNARIPGAIRLDRRARVSRLPGFSEGLFSVQDAGAQAAADLLRLADGQRVLDACSAPGGKAAHILETAAVELIALELDPLRARSIDASLTRLGLAAEIVVGDAQHPQTWWDGRRFDRILVDAPCSATGVIRRHPEIRWLRRPADMTASSATQAAMLAALWPLLQPGGLLVYATCSILHAENRETIDNFLATHDDAQLLDTAPVEAVDTQPGFQILPGSLDRDGFYYACLARLRR